MGMKSILGFCLSKTVSSSGALESKRFRISNMGVNFGMVLDFSLLLDALASGFFFLAIFGPKQ